MIKSKNKVRHKWIDDGGKNPIYCYTCLKCGFKKIKNDSFSASYYDQNETYLSGKAPECIEQLNTK